MEARVGGQKTQRKVGTVVVVTYRYSRTGTVPFLGEKGKGPTCNQRGRETLLMRSGTWLVSFFFFSLSSRLLQPTSHRTSSVPLCVLHGGGACHSPGEHHTTLHEKRRKEKKMSTLECTIDMAQGRSRYSVWEEPWCRW